MKIDANYEILISACDELPLDMLNHWHGRYNEFLTLLVLAMAQGKVKFRCDGEQNVFTELWKNQLSEDLFLQVDLGKDPDLGEDLDGTLKGRKKIIRKLLDYRSISIDPEVFSAFLDSLKPPGPADRNKEFYGVELRIIDEVYHELYINQTPPEKTGFQRERKRITKWLDKHYSQIGTNRYKRIAAILNPFPPPRSPKQPTRKK